MTRSFHNDLNDPHLFEDNQAGVYTYDENEAGGRTASGSLTLADNPKRDSSAQLAAGGEARRGRDHEWGHDEGGHLIGARFGGASSSENLVAQDSNFNRSAYKKAENRWADHLKRGDKVFVNIDTSRGDRPDSYQGYAILEHPDGTRDYELYSFNNESSIQINQLEERTDAALAADSSLTDDWQVSPASDEYAYELEDWGEGSDWFFGQSGSHDKGIGMG